MKKMDLVRLINDIPYKNNNIRENMRGIVVDWIENNVLILFFNPLNIGDYAIVNVNARDLVVEKEKLPDKIQQEIMSKLDIILKKAKDSLKPTTINEYDMVELLVEKEAYSKYGIHKGARGFVMDNSAIQNYIEVDFSNVNELGHFSGDCISVRIDDLKVVK